MTVELHPGDVVADALHRPAGQSGLHHGQVGLPAGAGKRRSHVALLSLRVGDSQNLTSRGERGGFKTDADSDAQQYNKMYQASETVIESTY